MELQNELKNIANAWNLKLEGESKYSATGLIVFASQDGIPCVLKLFASGSDEKLSAQVLSHYRGNGAIKVLQTSANALLLERCLPGTPRAGIRSQMGHKDVISVYILVYKSFIQPKHRLLNSCMY